MESLLHQQLLLSFLSIFACVVLSQPTCQTYPVCHGGLDLSCEVSESQFCTADIQLGDACRQYAHCENGDGGCVMTGDSQMAVERCAAFIQSCANSLPVLECESWGLTVDFTNDVIAQNCDSWFDGCNTCTVSNGLPEACTEMYCSVMTGIPGCVDSVPDCVPDGNTFVGYPDECDLIRFSCIEGTEYWNDESCGCGCQPSSNVCPRDNPEGGSCLTAEICEYGTRRCCDGEDIAEFSCRCDAGHWLCRDTQCDENSLQCQLETAEINWRECQHECYSYNLRASCFCVSEFVAPKIVVVEEGSVTVTFENGTDAPDWSYPSSGVTIEDLFLYIQTLIDQSGDANSVDFDEECGIPLEIRADPIPLAIDDELTITISNFLPHDCPASCCAPNSEPGSNQNPFCFEGATCCSNGEWQCNSGNGQSTCSRRNRGSICGCCEPEDLPNCPYGGTCCDDGHWKCNRRGGGSRCDDDGFECACCPSSSTPSCENGVTCCSHGEWACNNANGQSTCIEDGRNCEEIDENIEQNGGGNGCPETDDYLSLTGEQCFISAGTCYFGEETCCGESHPSFFCSCHAYGDDEDVGTFACGYTDSCLGAAMYGCDDSCIDENCNAGDSCVEAHDGAVACSPSCEGGACGNFDCEMETAICVKEPCFDIPVCDCGFFCTALYDPVIGCDGATYSNSCEMSRAQCNNPHIAIEGCDVSDA